MQIYSNFFHLFFNIFCLNVIDAVELIIFAVEFASIIASLTERSWRFASLKDNAKIFSTWYVLSTYLKEIEEWFRGMCKTIDNLGRSASSSGERTSEENEVWERSLSWLLVQLQVTF